MATVLAVYVIKPLDSSAVFMRFVCIIILHIYLILNILITLQREPN